MSLSEVDEGQINALLDGMVKTWNAHDMDAFGELLWHDAVALQYIGTLSRNKEEFISGLRFMHSTAYRTCRLSSSTDLIRAVAPGVAVAVVRNDLAPDMSDPTTVLRGRYITVLVEREGEWRIASFQNTQLRDDVN